MNSYCCAKCQQVREVWRDPARHVQHHDHIIISLSCFCNVTALPRSARLALPLSYRGPVENSSPFSDLRIIATIASVNKQLLIIKLMPAPAEAEKVCLFYFHSPLALFTSLGRSDSGSYHVFFPCHNIAWLKSSSCVHPGYRLLQSYKAFPDS